MSTKLPKYMVLQAYGKEGCLYFRYQSGSLSLGTVVLGDESVFSTYVKIAVERAESSSNLVHLLFVHTNKYWAYDADQQLILAASDKPEEDTSKPTCTLFEPTVLNDDEGLFYLTHVQSGGRVQISDSVAQLNPNPSMDDGYLVYVNSSTLVQLPSHVAFKGDNGSFLKAIWFYDHPYQQFSSGDANNERSGYQIDLMPDGHVRILCLHFDKYWRNSHNWIWADSLDNTDKNTLFWPVKIDDTTIALRSVRNNLFCVRLTTDGNTNCLNADAHTIVNEAKLQVQELVLERNIYNVRYMMEYARVFDEKPYLAGTANADNHGEEEGSIAVAVTYTDEKSYSFTRGLSISTGMTTTIKVDVLGIEEGEVGFSFEFTGSFEWGQTTTTTQSITATGTVPVPPKKRAKVNYVGTVGTCSVPFSYTRQDKSSTDGQVVETDEIDGIFTGVNYYSFSFVVSEYEPLPPSVP